MKTKLILALTLSVLAANTFAADGYDRTGSAAYTTSASFAADGADHVGAGKLASDGFDHTGAAKVAADGFDHTGAAKVAADGSDHVVLLAWADPRGVTDSPALVGLSCVWSD